MNREQRNIAALQKITGYNNTGVLTNKNGYFMLAYCFRNGNKLSQWFVEYGSFDKIIGAYDMLTVNKDYLNNEIGVIMDVYTILFELHTNRNRVVRIITRINIGDSSLPEANYQNMLVLSDDLPTFYTYNYIDNPYRK